MGLRTVFLLLVGLALAGVGALALIGGNGAPDETAEAPPPEVLVARSRLPSGTIIEADSVAWSRHDGDVPKGAVVRGETPRTAVVGAAVRNEIPSGDPVRQTAVVRPDEDGFVSSVLPPGARAMSVPARGRAAASGLLRPNDTVDVIVSWDAEDGVAAKTVVSGVRVLAVGGRVSGAPEDSADSVTLQVSPQQAKRLAVAAGTGRLTLSLRGRQADPATEAGSNGAVTARELLGQAANAVPETDDGAISEGRDADATARDRAPAPDPDVSVRVITGGESRTVTVPSDPPRSERP